MADGLSVETEQSFHLEGTWAPHFQCQACSRLARGLEDTRTQVCTSCMGRWPLHTVQRCAINVRKQEIKPHSFLDCFRLMVQSHLWWQVCPIFVHSFWQRQEHPCITLVVMESLCLSGSNLVLGRLLRQLRVRRKRVLKHYTPGAPCNHSLPPCKTCPQVGQGCMACVLLQGKCHHSMWPSFG